MGSCCSSQREAPESDKVPLNRPDSPPPSSSDNFATMEKNKGRCHTTSRPRHHDKQDQDVIIPHSFAEEGSDNASAASATARCFPTSFRLVPNGRAGGGLAVCTPDGRHSLYTITHDGDAATDGNARGLLAGGAGRRGRRRPGLRLHSAASRSSPMLAGVRPSVGGMIVSLPEINAHNRDYGGDDDDDEEVVPVRDGAVGCGGGGIATGTAPAAGAYAFGVEVGDGKGRVRRERFLWRRDDDDGIEGGRDRWVLVRAEGGASRASAVESDGNNGPLAVWDAGVVTDGAAGSSSELHFRFVGQGSTGVLGERWELMVVMAALGAWQRMAA